MEASAAAEDGAHGTQLHEGHDVHNGHNGHDGEHEAAHVHVLTALQEEAFYWTAGCFVVAAIVFAIWTLRTMPPSRKTQRKAGRKKRRMVRRGRRLRVKPG
jgi:hypothetical protein